VSGCAASLTDRKLSQLVNLICFLLAILALFVLAGWCFGDVATRNYLSARMKAGSALALLFGAVSLFLENGNPSERPSERLSHWLAMIPMALGAANLLYYLADFGPAYRQLIEGNGPEFYGPMAPNSAFCILVLSVALFVLDGKTWLNRLAQRLAIISACISLFAVFGYIFEAQELYKISSHIRMSHFTAPSLLALSIGVLLARPDNGIVNLLLRKTPTGVFTRRMMLTAFVLPTLLGWLGMIAEDKGLLTMTSAWAITSLLMIILFTTFVWQSAESLSANEIALKDNEMLFRSLANSIPQLTWITDPSGNVEWYNQRWFDYTGTTHSEMEGWGWQKVHEPSSLPRTIASWKKSLETVTDWESVLQLRAQDGSYRWFLSRAIPLRDSSGKVVRWFGSNTDVDVQRRIEKSLRESEQRYATLTSSIPQLVWSCLPDGRCNYLSKQWIDYTGVPEDEQLNFDWLSKVIHPEDRERTFEHWMGAVDGLHPYDIGYRIKRFDDEYRWFTVRGNPMRDDSGQIIYWVGTCTDVHEQKLITEELNEAKLIAERANQAKTHFLANMSHEIRTPIGAISGFTELLKNSSSSEADKLNYMLVIERNSRHLLRLIDDILDLSKVEAGKIVFENLDFSLIDFLSDFNSVISLRAGEKGLSYTVSVDGLLPDTVNGDQLRLRQILANLAGNAIKFTERGFVQIGLRHEGSTFHVVVRDTGIGISTSQASALFQPFQQADPSFTRKFGGTGLGLVLSRRLANLLGGDIVLESSTPGVGSVFVATIQLPATANSRLVSLEDGGHQKTRVIPEAPESARLLEGLRVLLVEDSPDNRTLVATFLLRTGAIVEMAEDGVIGYEKALGSHFDVVLMDIQMPRMDGHETMRRLREKGFSRPIIALTAHAMREERDKCFASGCTDYMTKPLQKQKLFEVLQKYTRTL
jgi:PAS domain S-box-containing protein